MTELLLTVGVQCLFAVLLDMYLGEVARWHPFDGFRKLAKMVEGKLYPENAKTPKVRLLPGLVALFATVISIAFCVWLLVNVPVMGWVVSGTLAGATNAGSASVMGWVIEVIILYFAIGGRSLAEHAHAVSKALLRDDIEEAHAKTSWLVGRETKDLPSDQMMCATIESVLGNGNSSVFGVLFWFVIAGAPGAVIYRLTSTLDAMWGHKNDRYLHFGRPVTVLDDLLNWVPVRLTAITYAIQGKISDAFHCSKNQASIYKSKSGGAAIAAGAGALGFTLEGKEENQALGCGDQPTVLDIERSVSLVSTGTWIWVSLILWVSSLVVVAMSPVI